MTIRAAIAAALLLAGLGMGTSADPAGAAPVAPRAEIAAQATIPIDHRWERRRQSYRHYRHYRPYRRHYYRSRQVCFTRYVIQYSYWGARWVPVRSCYWR